ncbi:hypothetical protein B0T11DRAFT_298390 [Plectosphaerella cucumerina]|uniref:2EXR domain-containing protein n=1 Tax=Plectosphaerella cucumerina TaxID=40658 RepID=A0A8K0TKC1_9PEZI|nr:hypothetical protein B0T11DRAFT_298390 [Plectosphaerella cucumerina]
MAELNTFEPFSRLPTELRQQIWRQALSATDKEVWLAIDLVDHETQVPVHLPTDWFGIYFSSDTDDEQVDTSDLLSTPASFFAPWLPTHDQPDVDDHSDADDHSDDHSDADGHSDAEHPGRPSVAMSPLRGVYSVHYVGQVCLESRLLAQTLSGTWSRFPGCPWNLRLFGTDWESSTIYLGYGCNVLRMLATFSANEKALLRNIAFEWVSYSSVLTLMRYLQAFCPDLRTVSVLIAPDFPASRLALRRCPSPTAEMIKQLTSIATSSDPDVTQVPLLPDDGDVLQARRFIMYTAKNEPRLPHAKFYFLPLV